MKKYYTLLLIFSIGCSTPQYQPRPEDSYRCQDYYQDCRCDEFKKCSPISTTSSHAQRDVSSVSSLVWTILSTVEGVRGATRGY